MHIELQLLMGKRSKADQKVEAVPDNQSTSKTKIIVPDNQSTSKTKFIVPNNQSTSKTKL